MAAIKTRIPAELPHSKGPFGYQRDLNRPKRFNIFCVVGGEVFAQVLGEQNVKWVIRTLNERQNVEDAAARNRAALENRYVEK